MSTGNPAYTAAGEKYAHYECDRCHRPIGPRGRVKLRTTEYGLVLVWSCRCEARCA